MNDTASSSPKTEIQLKPIDLELHTGIILFVLLLFFVLYFFMPVFSFRFLSWSNAIAFSMIPVTGIAKLRKPVKYIYIFLAAYIIIAFVVSLEPFRAREYRNLIGEVQTTEFSELVSPIKLDQVPTVDRAFAASLAEKKLGEDFALGSRVSLGWPTRQMVRGQLYWVVPLLHSGFFKWFTNINNGTPGYIMVSAINPQRVEFVRELEGRPISIKYQPEAFFQQDLHRHLYLNGFFTKGLGDYTFEIDDEGEPYWTVTVHNNNIGVMGPEAYGLAVVHAGTGKISYHPMRKTATGWSDEKIPAWVDRVQPADFVLSQLNWWGKYVRGFWNTLFGKRDMLMVTDGYNIIYGNDERSYFYTGMSSIGNDEGTVGFMLTDTRTKATHLYKISGATEYAAQTSAEGKVQNFKYKATFPILVNINGLATYFITLKDTAGLVKQFAFVSVKDFSIVGVGETIKTARDNYQITMAGSRIGNLAEETASEIKTMGIISRIGSDIKDARTYYYISLSEVPQRIFVASSDISSYLPLSERDDRVELEYYETQDSEISITGFHNLDLE